MTKIIVPHGIRKDIKMLLNVSFPTIRKALSGESKSLLSLQIRKLALEKGGVEIKKNE
ncbi:MAG: hypothetical protein QM654_04120 [Dysgonamonadaceae bacterium]